MAVAWTLCRSVATLHLKEVAQARIPVSSQLRSCNTSVTGVAIVIARLAQSLDVFVYIWIATHRIGPSELVSHVDAYNDDLLTAACTQIPRMVVTQLSSQTLLRALVPDLSSSHVHSANGGRCRMSQPVLTLYPATSTTRHCPRQGEASFGRLACSIRPS